MGRELGQRVEGDPLEGHLAVNLVGDDGQLVARGNVDEAEQVLLGEDGAARVGRVVDDQGLGARVDKALELREVRLPPLARQQVVLLDAGTLRLGEDLVEREARLRHQQVVALVHDAVDRNLERSRAAARDDDVRGLVDAVRRREALGDGCARVLGARGVAVSVVLRPADERDHRLTEHLRRLEVAKCGGITEREWDHRLSLDRLALLRGDLLHDGADRIRSSLRLDRHGHVPRLGVLGRGGAGLGYVPLRG
mmetsp:Transcript_36985/g.119715  ORF Transcript_36985/g.119715 Transcript_36985/m.119715 type:complete len:252 (-) Transcript_36985:63-818(-)